MTVTRFRSKAERALLRQFDHWRQIAMEFPDDEGRDHMLRRIAEMQRAAEGWRFMQVSDEREAQIIDHLKANARAFYEAAEVLRAVRSSLGPTSQRMTLTQAEIATKLGLKAPNASRAFRALREAGAIMAPIRERGSVTYEVDATFATRLSGDERAIAARRQGAQPPPARVIPLREITDLIGSE